MTPEPIPLVGCPKGEKPDVLSPSAVIVTTDRRAWAMTSVRSAFRTVVAPVVVALPTPESGIGIGTGASWRTASAVPPDARTADSSGCGEDRREPARRRSGTGAPAGAAGAGRRADRSSGPGVQAYTGSGRMGGYGEVMRQAP